MDPKNIDSMNVFKAPAKLKIELFKKPKYLFQNTCEEL